MRSLKTLGLILIALSVLAHAPTQAQTVSSFVVKHDSAALFFKSDSLPLDAVFNCDIYLFVSDAVSGVYALFAIGDDTTNAIPVWKADGKVLLRDAKAKYIRRKSVGATATDKVKCGVIVLKRTG